MTPGEYVAQDAMGLAALVRGRQVSAIEVLDAMIARVEASNPTLNAVVADRFDAARADTLAGALPDGPFHGVPYLIKDLHAPVVGLPLTHASRLYAGNSATFDSTTVARLRAAGFVIAGRSNSPEFGMSATTEPALHGPTRNPWSLEHSPGGSSGGAAAAVAGGMLPAAHATDSLGSIRIPAACCGLVGLKPTRDRSPHLPDGYDFAQGFVVEHVLTRTVRDSAVMLDVTGVPEPGSPYAIPAKERPYAEEILRSPGKLKIAFSSETANGRPCHPEVQAALEATATLLEQLGHEVVPHGPGVDQRELWGSQGAFSGAIFAAGMRKMIEGMGREPADDEFEPLTWASWKGGQRQTGMDAMADMQKLRMMGRQALRLFETFDVFLTPTLAAPPPPIGYLSPVLNTPRDVGRRNGEFFSYPGVANMTGAPSISLPLAWSSAGLPMGMMFTSGYANEAVLFRLAAQLEKEAPWKDKRPGVWG